MYHADAMQQQQLQQHLQQQAAAGQLQRQPGSPQAASPRPEQHLPAGSPTASPHHTSDISPKVRKAATLHSAHNLLHLAPYSAGLAQ
jgi:hypothetical protein